MQKAILGRWLDWVLALLAAYAIFATPYQMLALVGSLDEATRITVAATVLFAVVGWIWTKPVAIARAARFLFESARLPPLWVLAVLGLSLRLAWAVYFSPEPASDGKLYLALASRLASGEGYEVAGTRAYWPPGYPLLLTPLVMFFDDAATAYLALNLGMFLLGLSGVTKMAHLLAANERVARAAGLLFAVWPNLVFQAATPEKELVVLGLLPWSMAFILRAMKERSNMVWSVLAGTCLGAALLVQPSLQLLPFAAAVLLIAMSAAPLSAAKRAAALLLSAALIVAPWTVRNYMVFDRFVLVSTNGGDVLYRANNPLATGAYQARGAIDLDRLPELEKDHAGRRYAFDWIAQHPSTFLGLALRKQTLFMGDDAVGAYTTFGVGRGSGSSWTYAFFKAIATVWWWVVWVSILALAITTNRKRVDGHPLFRLPIWCWLYLFGIHTIFESAGKYHVPMLFVPCVMLATLLFRCSTLNESTAVSATRHEQLPGVLGRATPN